MENDLETVKTEKPEEEFHQASDDIVAIVENAINTFESDDIYEDESIDDIPDDDEEIEDFDDVSSDVDFSDADEDVDVDDLFDNI